MTVSGFGELVLWLVGGLALGAIYFRLIGQSVAAFMESGAKRSAVGYFVLRIVLAAGAFWVAANQGALPLLAMLLGFLAARTLTIRKIGKGEIGR